MGQSLLLLFSALAFTLLLLGGIYPAEIRSVNIDSDWIYRKGGKMAYALFDNCLNSINAVAHKVLISGAVANICRLAREGPTHILTFLLTPIWEISGTSDEQRDKLRESLRKNVHNGVFPIGITACLSVLLLGILFFF